MNIIIVRAMQYPPMLGGVFTGIDYPIDLLINHNAPPV